MTYWAIVNHDLVLQGDLLVRCPVPRFPEDFVTGQEATVRIDEADLIVVTQSCDLENNKVDHVAMCPAYTLEVWADTNASWSTPAQLELIRKGRVAALHMLGSRETPDENRGVLIVDFGHVISLPVPLARKHARDLGQRHRLLSPYLEHFSQAFARFFMRVGLPGNIPAFR